MIEKHCVEWKKKIHVSRKKNMMSNGKDITPVTEIAGGVKSGAAIGALSRSALFSRRRSFPGGAFFQAPLFYHRRFQSCQRIMLQNGLMPQHTPYCP